MIPALVLTAGLATRLRPLSLVRAKAAIPVGGQPLVRRILAQLAGAGVRDAVLNLHHLPHTIASRVGDGADLGVRVRYSWESPQVLGSAGGPRRALGIVGAPTFLVVNGDTLADVDIALLVDAHRTSGALVTLAVIPNAHPSRYGGVVADDAGRFTGVVRRGASEPSWHFIGAQAVQAEAFAALEDGVPTESIGALYPTLAATRPGTVRIHRCASSFLDIGTPEDYVASCRSFAAPGADLIEQGQRVHVSPSAQLRQCAAWDDVEIGPDARLERTILTDGVSIPAGATWANVILRRADGAACQPGEQLVGNLIATPW